MEEDFRALLLADSGVSAIASGRVNFGEHPQGDPLPAIVLTVVSDFEGKHMNGRDGMTEARVQVDCYAMTYGQVKALGREVRACLHMHRGGRFLLIEHAGGRDGRESGANEADRPYRVSMDFTTYWRPT